MQAMHATKAPHEKGGMEQSNTQLTLLPLAVGGLAIVHVIPFDLQY